MRQKNIPSIIRENKTLFIIIVIGLFLLELEIFALAATRSGKKTWIKVYHKGSVIHESLGSKLSDTDRIYIEKTFGPIGQFNVRLVTQTDPFPFRAWFVAAAGIPVAIILLFSFIVKVYSSLFHEVEKETGNDDQNGYRYSNESKLDKVLSRISRYNVYTIGFLVFLAIFAYWVVPNFMTYIGRLGVDALIQYKWFFIAVSAVLLSLVVWIIYLRYLLAKRAMDGQMEMEKFRLALEYRHTPTTMMQVGYGGLMEKNSREHTTNTS